MKKFSYIFSFILLLLFFSCKDLKNSETNEVDMKEQKQGTIMQIVKLKTTLSEEEFFKIAKECESQFKAISGTI